MPGFTLIDALVLVAFLSVVAAIIVARGVAVKRATRLARCTANLQQVDHAVLTFADEHGQTLPAAVADVPGNIWWWYKEQVKGYLGLKGPSATSDAIFACPDDRGYSEPTPFHLSPRFDYGSYVFNGVTLGGLPNIAGCKLASVNRPKQTLLVMEWTAHAPLSWHQSKTGRNNMPFYCDAQSVVGFVDGHVSFTRIYYDGFNAAYTRDPIPGYEYQYSGN